MRYSFHPNDSFCCLRDLPGSFFPYPELLWHRLTRSWCVSIQRQPHFYSEEKQLPCSGSCTSPEFVSAVVQHLKYGCTAWESFWR